LLGLVALLLLAATGLLVGLTLGVRGAMELVLATYVAAFATLVALFLFLSAFNAVERGVLVAALAASASAAASCWFLAGAPWPLLQRSWPRSAPQGPLLLLALALALGLAYVLALVVGTPPNGWDPLNYHLPRAAFWTQSGGIAYIDAAYDERLNFNPPHAEIGFAAALDVTRNEHFVGFVQLFAAVTCAVAVYGLAQRFRLTRAEAAFGALLFLSLPLMILQSSGAKNDLVVASFLAAATVFVLGRTRGELALAGVATALAVGTKFTAAYGVALLIPLALVAAPRTRRFARIGSVVLGAAVGSYWYAVNLYETHHLLGDQSNVPGLTAPFQPRENILTAYGMLVDTFDLSGASGKDILIYALVGVVLALVLALRRHTHALLAGTLVATPLLLYLIATEVGRPSLVRLYEVLDEPKGNLGEGDFASATVASDTGSWFGPVGFLLVVGTGIAVLALTRRRSLDGSMVVVALAPFAWFVLVALTLTYNPWLGRFFVYPVVLSAALWGLALRKRVAAWPVAAMAAVTLALSLVHYVEKPAKSVWQQKRWEVQSQHDPPLASTFRFLDTEVSRKTSIALALGANDFGYPPFGPHVSRQIDLVPFGSSAHELGDRWLVASSERSGEIDTTCWQTAFADSVNTVFRRRLNCR
jgi:4-amino-4-deoxy-L-arabinose transferase-like glycosyltransferase